MRMTEEMLRIVSNIRQDMYNLNISENVHDVYWKHDGDSQTLIYPGGELALPQDEELTVLILMVFHLGLSVGGLRASRLAADQIRSAGSH